MTSVRYNIQFTLQGAVHFTGGSFAEWAIVGRCGSYALFSLIIPCRCCNFSGSEQLRLSALRRKRRRSRQRREEYAAELLLLMTGMPDYCLVVLLIRPRCSALVLRASTVNSIPSVSLPVPYTVEFTQAGGALTTCTKLFFLNYCLHYPLVLEPETTRFCCCMFDRLYKSNWRDRLDGLRSVSGAVYVR